VSGELVRISGSGLIVADGSLHLPGDQSGVPDI
jgi:hypothetical protein